MPKDTPKDIIAKLNATMVQVLADPPVQKRFGELGIEITPPDAAIAGSLAGVSEAGSRALVADHQGVEYQGGLSPTAIARSDSDEAIQSRARISRLLRSARNDGGGYTFSSFCRHRFTLTSAGIAVSGKLVFQLVTPTSPR